MSIIPSCLLFYAALAGFIGALVAVGHSIGRPDTKNIHIHLLRSIALSLSALVALSLSALMALAWALLSRELW